MTWHFMFFHCGCIFCTHAWVLHNPPKNDSTFHVFSLWMHILHSCVSIAQSTKKWLNISCFFVVDAYFALICEYCTSHQKMTQHFMFFCCGCIFCTHMWVLHNPPKNDSTFHVFSLWMHILHSCVSIAQATKKWLNISCLCGYWQHAQKTNKLFVSSM
jgi:hypothetical protein